MITNDDFERLVDYLTVKFERLDRDQHGDFARRTPEIRAVVQMVAADTILVCDGVITIDQLNPHA